MATKKKDNSNAARRRPPAITLEARENELIAKAVDEAEKRIENGTASDSLLIHWLRQGTVRMQLEKSKLEADVKLAEAKAESIAASKRQEELAAKAIKAMKTYTGQLDDIYEDEYDD
jgi:hypothetical protein